MSRSHHSSRNWKALKSTGREILRYIRVAYVLLTLLLILLFIWVYKSYVAGPGAFHINEYHPFKSELAKEEYLDYYEEKARDWPLESEERMVSTSYGKTFVRISGPKEGMPLVLLPGGGRSSLMWKNNIIALSEHYRTYALDDIYDWGRSIYTKRMGCPESITKWLNELFTALELGDSINLVGHSFGGWKACQYLLEYPERLNKIVIYSPAYAVYRGNKEFEKRVFRGFIPFRYFMKKELYWVSEHLVETEEGRAIADEMVDENLLAIKCFKTKIPASMTVMSDHELKNIKLPVLYIAGEDDKIMAVNEAADRLNRLVKDVRTEVIPDADHCLFITHPDLVSERILDFLKD